jgi:hypothetical protein
MFRKYLSASTFVLVAVAVCTSFAQSSPSDYQPATVAFDFRVKKAREGELMKMLDVANELGAWQQGADLPEGVDIEKVDRVFGAMSLPDDIETFQSMSGEEKPEVLPMDLFIQVKCADADTAKAMFGAMEEKSDKVEINGKTFLKPPAEEGLSNMLMHMPDDTTVEMGTKPYLLQDKRLELFSEGLAAAWKRVPDHAFRLAFDVKGSSKLIAEAVEMGKASTQDATAKAYLDLVDNAENFRLSIDFDADNMIVFAATGVDESQSEDLRSGLDAVMGMAKIGGKQTLPMVIPDPEVMKVAGEILDSLKATAEGTEVQIAIPKPGGFNDVVKKSVDQLKQMQQMMQQQGPPEGFGGDDGGDSDGGGQ